MAFKILYFSCFSFMIYVVFSYFIKSIKEFVINYKEQLVKRKKE